MSGDSMDSYLDLSEFDAVSQLSPSLSPSATKAPYTRTTPTTTSAAPQTIIPQSQPSFTGPSHQYDLYKQQTGLVPGAVANTLAVNQANNQISGNWDMGFGSGSSPDESFDFNTVPSQGGSMGTPDMDVDFGSPGTDSFLFPESTINPNAIGGQESPVLPSQTSNVGRLWPGMHQQAAVAKAQAQQRQQQQIIQQQQQQRQQQQQHHAKRPSKGGQPSDPIVEQKITQLLNSMRAKPGGMDMNAGNSPMHNLTRPKKEEEEMDEDERLLASDEGKKLSSKERRQLRNKVSARAFRSRRKEYISQLESEIANKVTENGDLRAQNHALLDENKRLSDLTRMLLSSPSFSNFLENLSSNPQTAPQPEPQRQPEAQRQLPKDVNPYASGQVNQHQIGMAMVPEQNMDFNMVSMESSLPSDGFNFQPQVYAATIETPEVIDTSVLSGKTSNFVTSEEEDDESKDAIVIDHEEKLTFSAPIETPTPVEEEDLDENDESLDLYRSSPSPAIANDEPTTVSLSEEREDSIFGGIETEKAFARYELTDPTEAETQAAAEEVATFKLDRFCSRLDASIKRMEKLCFK
ncbi:bZIP transcription factor [Zalerion maritima]|uniref:BZIP transcription factor n=1 Tax=Zalerion maritima TaxID=339359 RepID=A0AAD5RKH5_9PEZI|nr:bZIP transcription factor [Zalerion maritima]